MTADLDSIYIRIDSTDSIKDTHIDWGTAANQVSAADIPMATISGSTFSTVQHMQNLFHSSGWVSGGVVTDNGNNTVAVTDGTGAIKASAGTTQEILFFDWSENLSVSVPSDTTRYVGIEYNNGSPQIVVKTTDSFDDDTDFILASLINEGGTIHIQKEEHAVGDHSNNMINRLFDTAPFARDNRGGGLILGESGDNNRTLTMTAGVIWEKLNKFTITNFDSSVGGGDTFDRYLTDGAGGHTKQTGQTTWDNTQFDSSGTLTALDNNKYAVQWFYIELDGEFVSVYGTAQYNTEGEAETESPPSDIPDRISLHGKLIGRIIFKESETTPRATESVFTATFTTAGVTDHLNLANVGTNTHAQIDTHIASAANPHSVTLDQAHQAGNTITLGAGELIVIPVTRSGSETTPMFDIDIADSSSAQIDYFDIDITKTGGAGTTRIFAVLASTDSSGDLNVVDATLSHTGAGNIDAFKGDVRTTGSGEIACFNFYTHIESGDNNPTARALLAYIDKNQAGGEIGGLDIIEGGSSVSDYGLRFQGDGAGFTDGIKFLGTFVDGIDLSAATTTTDLRTNSNLIFGLPTGKFIDINVTRSGSETTQVIDLDIADSSSGNYNYIDFTAVSSGTGHQTVLNLSHTSSNVGDAQPLYVVATTTGAGDAWAGQFEALSTGGGDAYGILGSAYDQSGQTIANIFGAYFEVGKYLAGSTAIGVQINAAGTQTTDTGLKFTGTITTGIDLSTATITNAIKMGNAQTLYDGSNSLSFANLKTAYDHSQLTSGNPHEVTLGESFDAEIGTRTITLDASTDFLNFLMTFQSSNNPKVRFSKSGATAYAEFIAASSALVSFNIVGDFVQNSFTDNTTVSEFWIDSTYGHTNTTKDWGIGSDGSITWDLGAGESLYPETDNQIDFGETTKRWKDIWFAGNLRDDTDSISVTNLKTSLDHSQDNTQAHTDYFLNTGSDIAGSGSGFTWTFNASAGTDPVITFGNGTIDVTTGSFNIGSSTAISSILDEDNMVSNSATALATQQSIKAYVDVGGGIPTAITVTDESADTTCFPAFFTAATGDLGPKTGTNLTFNSNTGLLTATSFSGDGSALTAIPASAITAGTFGAGDYVFPGDLVLGGGVAIGSASTDLEVTGSGGGLVQFSRDDTGSEILSGETLGGIKFGGVETDIEEAIAALMLVRTTEAWGAAAAGAEFVWSQNKTGSINRSDAMTLTDTNLTVFGNLTVNLTSGDAPFEVGAEATTSVDIAHFSNSNGAVKARFQLDSAGAGELELLDQSNNIDVHIDSNGVTYFKGGNVVIGGTSAAEKLQIVAGNILLDNDQTYQIKDTTGATRNAISLNINDNLVIGSGGIDDVLISVGTLGTAVRIQDTTGFVGIGVTPTVLLHLEKSGSADAFPTSGTSVLPETHSFLNLENSNVLAKAVGIWFRVDATAQAQGDISLVSDVDGNVESRFSWRLRHSGNTWAEKMTLSSAGDLDLIAGDFDVTAGDLSIAAGALSVIKAGGQPVRFTQDATSGGSEVLSLNQDDLSEGFIDFEGSDRGAVETSSAGPGSTSSAASVRVERNGTKYVLLLFPDQ